MQANTASPKKIVAVKKPPGPSYCGVPQCNTYSSKDISMHRIPKRTLNNPELLEKWKVALKMQKPFPKYFVICCKHFVPTQIIRPISRGQLTKRRLVETAFPTLNLPKSPGESAANATTLDASVSHTTTKKRKAKPFCGVPQCTSYKTGKPSFHRIPKRVLTDPKELLKWKVVLRMGKPFPKNFCICSHHFEPNKILTPIDRGQKRKTFLLSSAFPTRNLPQSSITTKRCAATIKARYERLRNRTIKKEAMTQPLVEPEKEDDELIEDCAMLEPMFEFVAPCASIGVQTSVRTKDTAAQVDDIELQNFPPFHCETDEHLRITTGIPTFKILDTFVKLCEEACPQEAKRFAMPLRRRIFLTMYKIKHNLSYPLISFTFNISEGTVRTYFNRTILLLQKANILNTYKYIFDKIK